MSAGEARASEAIAAAERFLLERQSDDGLWRDYPTLAPGPSEAWVTAVVAWALTAPPLAGHVAGPVAAAAEALHALRKGDGWGYNRDTAVDADSTAWVWRFLSRIDDYRGLPASRDLSRFLSPEGAARTFDGHAYGAWARPHADVTPVVGLALVEVHAPAAFQDRVRAAVLAHCDAQDLWRAYWWTSDAYAIARNLEFLRAHGGITGTIERRVGDWLDEKAIAQTSFDVAQRLAAAVCIGAAQSERLGEALMGMQARDGGWLASRTLRVPAQRIAQAGAASQAHADEQRLMSTALAMAALKSWLVR
jgi:hypothetical protein